MPELNPAEQAAYRLLFDAKLSAAEASRQLEAKGVKMSPIQLRNFKKSLFNKLQTEERQERMAEYMLTSFERTKIEFEDAVKRTKLLLDKYEAVGDTWKQAYVLDKLTNLITLALKQQGRLDKAMMNIHAKNVNILNPADLAQAFKRIQESWFGGMGASLEEGRLVLHNPSPELIDDFNRWRAKQLREAKRVDVDADQGTA